MSLATRVWLDVLEIRKRAPVVHNITNYVVMNSTANALLALGASPVMAHAEEEVEEMVGIASALVLNIGTLSERWIASMRRAAEAAARKGIPIVLDPVGAGATKLRTNAAHELLRIAPLSVIRGNASEVMALHGADAAARGVDSQHGSEAAVDAARTLSQQYGSVVSVSGVTDFIIRGDQTIRVHNGHVMMTRVTGLGCTASALTGAFCAVNPDPFEAAAHAMAVMGVVGELAEAASGGPGSLQVQFLDQLYRLREFDLIERLRMDRG
jgi:hydroxyethylthiazole kinase